LLNRIDEWESDLNFLSATKAQRYTALVMSGIALFLWIVRGWDSGVTSYGTSLHYSVFVIYGLEYAALNGSLGGLLAMKQGVHPTVDRLTMFLILPAIFWLISGFEQTCYPSVDGTIIYVENNLIHLYNVLAKLGLAFATGRFLMS